MSVKISCGLTSDHLEPTQQEPTQQEPAKVAAPKGSHTARAPLTHPARIVRSGMQASSATVGSTQHSIDHSNETVDKPQSLPTPEVSKKTESQRTLANHPLIEQEKARPAQTAKNLIADPSAKDRVRKKIGSRQEKDVRSKQAAERNESVVLSQASGQPAHSASASSKLKRPTQQSGERLTETTVDHGEDRVDSNNRPKMLGNIFHELREALKKLRPNSEQGLAEAINQILINQGGILGIAHVESDESGGWIMSEGLFKGRVPGQSEFNEKYGASAGSAVQTNQIQVEIFRGLTLLLTSVTVVGEKPRLVFLTCDPARLSECMLVLDLIREQMALKLKDLRFQNNRWKLASLAALVDLITQVESADNLREACDVVTNELVRYLSARQVAVAMHVKRRLRLVSISGETEINTKNDGVRAMETAIHETMIRNERCAYPAPPGSSNHLLLGHEQLAQMSGQSSVVSIPLAVADGDPVGVLLIMGQTDVLQSSRTDRFFSAVGSRLGSALRVIQRAERGWLGKCYAWSRKQAFQFRTYIILGSVLALIGLLFLPMDYRLRSKCEFAPTGVRHSVAPFDGIVSEMLVRPGDSVKKGDVIAKMDQQQIRIETASLIAELQSSRKMREINLVQDKVSESIVANLNAQSTQAKLNALQLKKEQSNILAPMDGLILGGANETISGASLRMGEKMIEVGTIDNLILEIPIPASDITHVSVGQRVCVWVNGFEKQTIDTTIEKIRPKSELKNAKNVFIAEVQIPNPDQKLRPGMRGEAQVYCEHKCLGWILFHKPWKQIQTRFLWW